MLGKQEFDDYSTDFRLLPSAGSLVALPYSGTSGFARIKGVSCEQISLARSVIARWVLPMLRSDSGRSFAGSETTAVVGLGNTAIRYAGGWVSDNSVRDSWAGNRHRR